MLSLYWIVWCPCFLFYARLCFVFSNSFNTSSNTLKGVFAQNSPCDITFEKSGGYVGSRVTEINFTQKKARFINRILRKVGWLRWPPLYIDFYYLLLGEKTWNRFTMWIHDFFSWNSVLFVKVLSHHQHAAYTYLKPN